MFLNFTNLRATIPFPHQNGVHPIGGVEFNESDFNRMLLQERKRQQRTHRPFMLMLVSLSDLPSGGNGSGPRSRVASALASTIRDVDLMGWYKTGSVLGIIFTEVNCSNGCVQSAPVLKRVHCNLSESLSPEELSKVGLSVQYFPNGETLTLQGTSALDRAVSLDEVPLRRATAEEGLFEITPA